MREVPFFFLTNKLHFSCLKFFCHSSDQLIMNKLILLILSFLLCSALHAQKAQVLILDEDIDARSLERNYQIHSGSTHRSSLPDKSLRDELFKELEEIQDWEEFKKDLFYMDLKKKPLNELKNKYPEIHEEKLKNLKDQL